MVWTSSSLALLQKSMPRLRQKAFVHCEQEEEAARLLRSKEEEEEVSRLEGGALPGGSPSACWGPRATMVLFLKQVHLQNVGAALEGC